ncbi:MAG: hypothetical protein A3B68_04335 [Candidatus Melainabacteria bacterium RIFCSPHIGHO2_02_FULL_34_12]|nr:MAG: hypothetical protein A3B68_04335 [Candidatus Melainabacteria bacterium RIFCSPHIGHO2_02_FULL_34_12]
MKVSEKVYFIENHNLLFDDPKRIAEIIENIRKGHVYIAKNIYPKDLIYEIRDYLTRIGKNSLPNYYPIHEGCHNFHRINQDDSRSYVKACFHQFVFFPWNQDMFNFFKLFEPVYRIKNLLSGLPEKSFLGISPENKCTARLAFQFYPSGEGFMNKHSDPVDYHQLTVPLMVMSTKGKDFQEGGLFIEPQDAEKILIDDFCDIGDVVYMNAQMPHGVSPIDPKDPCDWMSFKGRWMLLFAINKLSENEQIENSKDLGKT